MDSSPKESNVDVIVIGGGISGVATAKCMQDVGFSVILLERMGDVGGLWTYKERSYGVMKFTHINVSKYNYAFSDYPFPEGTPDYPHNTQMASYVRGYVSKFGLEKLIHYHTQVNEVTRSGENWLLSTERVEETKDGVITTTGETSVYKCKYVAIATGHHAKPKVATFPGQDSFKGKIYHSVDYKDVVYNEAVEKKVVVVGIGNSAVDAAVNCAAVGRCKPVYVSTRSGAWVVPNYIFGYPTDLYACRAFLWLPWKLSTYIFENIVSFVVGPPKKWGLYPKMHALQTQPTVSPTMIHHIQRGEIIVKPNIQRFEENHVHFTDGSKVEADQVILCTGYNISLPFLHKDITSVVLNEDTNELKLYKNVFSPDLGPSMAFIGFVQPASGGILTISEMQARWWAELCRQHVSLPDKNEMEKVTRQELEAVKSRYYHSGRHTLQKDPLLYNDDISSMIGCKPELSKHPWMAWRLLVGSCGAFQYRIQGPGAWRGAKEETKKVPVTSLMVSSLVLAVGLLPVLGYYLLYYGLVLLLWMVGW